MLLASVVLLRAPCALGCVRAWGPLDRVGRASNVRNGRASASCIILSVFWIRFGSRDDIAPPHFKDDEAPDRRRRRQHSVKKVAEAAPRSIFRRLSLFSLFRRTRFSRLPHSLWLGRAFDRAKGDCGETGRRQSCMRRTDGRRSTDVLIRVVAGVLPPVAATDGLL
jgi:hypothetical protein